MSVYTNITENDAQAVLDARGAGRLQQMEGIPRGIENSNFYLRSDTGEFVLTLLERQEPSCLFFSLRLMEAAADAGLPVSRPIRSRQGWLWDCIVVRPTILVERCPGEHLESPNAAQVEDLGRVLAGLHGLDPSGLPPSPPDPFDDRWRDARVAELKDELDADERTLLDRALDVVRSLDLAGLEKVPIHADVFRDNTLFQGERVSGLVDLYYAHLGSRGYELAIASNDFCRDGSGGFDPELEAALMRGYGELDEAEALPGLRVWAALRFWLSRLADAVAPRCGSMPLTKDPAEFRAVLAARLDELGA